MAREAVMFSMLAANAEPSARQTRAAEHEADLADVARADPDPSLRAKAITALAQAGGGRELTTLLRPLSNNPSGLLAVELAPVISQGCR